MEGVLVTGTGTSVGKTVVAAALVKGRPGATYVKPAQSGTEDGDDDARDVAALTGAPVRRGVALEEALAPAVAARRAGERLERPQLLAPFQHLDLVVGEGAGGLLVELGTDGTTLADLAVDLGLPLVVATLPGLGTLNHTLLTLEAAWARGLRVLGLVVNGWPEEPDLAMRTNLEELERMAPIMAVLPRLDPLSPETLPELRW